MSETWAPIPNHPGYEVSDAGNVRSWKVYGPVSPRLLTTRIEDGYLRVQLSRVSRRVHQLVLEAFVGPRPEGMLTRHIDGDRTNNALGNLAYGTASENMRDRVDHGNDPNATKTHCKNGHEYTAENTKIAARWAGGPTYRLCRKCRAATRRRRYEIERTTA